MPTNADRRASAATVAGGAPRPYAALLFGISSALLVALTLAPNLMWLAVDGAPMRPLDEILLPALATVALLLSLASRLWIGVLLLAPWAVLAPFEAYYILDFEKHSDAHLLGVIADSNLAEAANFLSGIAAGLGALSLAGALLSALALALAWRERIVWRGRVRRWILLASVLALILPEVVDLPGPARSLPIGGARAADQVLGMGLVDDHWPQVFVYLLPVYPVGVLGRLYTYLGQRQALVDARAVVADFRFAARQEPVLGREVHVLVIGETGRPDRWQLNGYARETNPRLSKLPGVLSFRDAFSAWAWTRMSVPLLLTRKSPQDGRQFFAEPSLVTAFREAGFRTYWLSTQSPQGPHDSSIALHAAEAHEAHFLNPLDYKSAGVFDGALLKPLDEILARGESKVLLVLHTLGGHFNYADRYPAEMDAFRPSLKGVRKPSLHQREWKAEMNNSYDSSVLYTDYFLAELIARLSAIDAAATLLYMADHGENLFDGDCMQAGHGRGNEYDFRVAALWWASPRYAAMFPGKVAAAASHVAAPIVGSNVFHSMLDAASIRFPGEDLPRSILSPQWRPSPRITQDGIDFDRSTRDAQCRKLRPVGGGRG